MKRHMLRDKMSKENFNIEFVLQMEVEELPYKALGGKL